LLHERDRAFELSPKRREDGIGNVFSVKDVRRKQWFLVDKTIYDTLDTSNKNLVKTHG
jgi:hypothetical protein